MLALCINRGQIVEIEDDFLTRFNSKVKRGPLALDCWEWTALRNVWGYGQIQVSRKSVLAHRIAYQLANGIIDAKICVLHTCDNPGCVNPAHLFLGSHADNVKDKVGKGRHCHGITQRNAKLSDSDVLGIRSRYKRGKVRQVDLAADFNVSQVLIGQIVNGVIWRHLPC